MNNLPNDCSISVKKIHFSYNEQKEIFSDLSFSIHSGDVFGLYGNNGSGKSTLLKIISGILYPTDGSIDITVHNQLVTRDS
ncbi:MAG TPA: ABC transporter ATP-binding protein, partial [Candidatus Kapabacteria bacterium]|nr:ABC transporter ATP-binding protein [Candidatus Kapabacteria bacterium]